mmetsp:Transcript_4967/g.16145  ORF Transcript_4967/g.16145 Transcript_4967/m.16145 type:complete len:279 (+) Transcript_4967:514-1350(+)
MASVAVGAALKGMDGDDEDEGWALPPSLSEECEWSSPLSSPGGGTTTCGSSAPFRRPPRRPCRRASHPPRRRVGSSGFFDLGGSHKLQLQIEEERLRHGAAGAARDGQAAAAAAAAVPKVEPQVQVGLESLLPAELRDDNSSGEGRTSLGAIGSAGGWTPLNLPSLPPVSGDSAPWAADAAPGGGPRLSASAEFTASHLAGLFGSLPDLMLPSGSMGGSGLGPPSPTSGARVVSNATLFSGTHADPHNIWGAAPSSIPVSPPHEPTPAAVAGDERRKN